MKKKIVATAVALTLAGGVLAGCGSGKASGGSDAIELWMPPLSTTDVSDKEGWVDILKPFTEKTGTKVNVTIVPWESYEEKYLTGISSNQGPDVGYMYLEMMGDYISRDQLVPFDEYLTDDERANYNYLDKGQFEGKQYAMPIVVGAARVMYYNKDLLKKAGVDTPPSTWEEFKEACQKVVDSGSAGYIAPWGSSARGAMNAAYYPFLWQAGGDLFTADGSATTFNTPEALEAATFLSDLKKEGLMPDSITGLANEQAQEMFIKGQAAFYIDDTSQLEKLGKEGVDVGVINSLTNKQQGTFVAADAMVVLKGCSDKKVCADLVKFMESAESMKKFHEWAPFPPLTKDEPYTGDKQFEKLYTQETDMFHSLPMVANSTAAYNVLYTNMQQMMLGQKTPEQALADAAKEGDAALKNGAAG